MAHRAKHLRRNWTPERLAKAAERKKAEDARKAADKARKLAGVKY